MESKFTGGLLGLIGVSLAVTFGSIFTLFIAYPWLFCFKQRWYAKHTYYDGVQMQFDGKGGQLIGNYLKWILLSIITIGIYSLWFSINLHKWNVKHTHRVASTNE